jgi:hypothetical protein
MTIQNKIYLAIVGEDLKTFKDLAQKEHLDIGIISAICLKDSIDIFKYLCEDLQFNITEIVVRMSIAGNAEGIVNYMIVQHSYILNEMEAPRLALVYGHPYLFEDLIMQGIYYEHGYLESSKDTKTKGMAKALMERYENYDKNNICVLGDRVYRGSWILLRGVITFELSKQIDDPEQVKYIQEKVAKHDLHMDDDTVYCWHSRFTHKYVPTSETAY